MHGEMAEKILTTANSLMVERGYSAFSYADIAELVGIRKASIHHHFPTKAGLAVAVLRAHRQRVIEATASIDAGIENPLARIQAYVQYWEGCIRDQTMPFCVAALLGAEMPSLPQEVQAEVRLHFQSLWDWLERTVKAGVRMRVIRIDSSAATEAQSLMALVHGAMLSARALGDCEIFKQVSQAAIERISAKP
jgi:TetR/AcrR family transcriptional repressor of nem operon